MELADYGIGAFLFVHCFVNGVDDLPGNGTQHIPNMDISEVSESTLDRVEEGHWDKTPAAPCRSCSRQQWEWCWLVAVLVVVVAVRRCRWR